MTDQLVVVVTCVLVVAVFPIHADSLKQDVAVEWDFGSGPGKTSNLYVGKRQIPVTYNNDKCVSRFTLEHVGYELAHIEQDGGSVPAGPPFIMFKFRKHFEGEFTLLPRIWVAQTKLNRKGKPTKRTEWIEFPFREKRMAGPVADWSASDIVVAIGAPGAIMGLRNPMDWSEIEVHCD